MLIGSALDYYGLLGGRGKWYRFFLRSKIVWPKIRSLILISDMIAIYSTNRYEYDAIIFGGYQANITNVALYDTLGLVLIPSVL